MTSPEARPDTEASLAHDKPRGLAAESLAFSYAKDSPVLKDVSANVTPGSFLGILGVNGSGKSTMLSCLDGMLKPHQGRVLIDGQPLSRFSRTERAQAVAYVTQQSRANRLTVYDALLLGRKPYVRSAPSEADFNVVDDVIHLMGLDGYALRYVDELSGGEYQKVVIARAFVQQPDVLLLDEPTNNLDMANQAEVMGLVRRAVDERKLAAAAVMHDLNLALRYCDRLLFMQGGHVHTFGKPEIVTPQLVRNIYGLEADVIFHRGKPVVIPL